MIEQPLASLLPDGASTAGRGPPFVAAMGDDDDHEDQRGMGRGGGKGMEGVVGQGRTPRKGGGGGGHLGASIRQTATNLQASSQIQSILCLWFADLVNVFTALYHIVLLV